MSQDIVDLLRQMFHFQLLTIVLIVGLYGYAIYGTIVITRIMRDIQRDVQGRR